MSQDRTSLGIYINHYFSNIHSFLCRLRYSLTFKLCNFVFFHLHRKFQYICILIILSVYLSGTVHEQMHTSIYICVKHKGITFMQWQKVRHLYHGVYQKLIWVILQKFMDFFYDSVCPFSSRWDNDWYIMSKIVGFRHFYMSLAVTMMWNDRALTKKKTRLWLNPLLFLWRVLGISMRGQAITAKQVLIINFQSWKVKVLCSLSSFDCFMSLCSYHLCK